MELVVWSSWLWIVFFGAAYVLLLRRAGHWALILGLAGLGAVLQRRLPIVPVRIEAVTPAGQLDYLLRTCQWLNAFDRAADAVHGEWLARLRAGADAGARAPPPE